MSLVTAAAVAGAGAASAVSDFKFDRIGGADRYETSTLVDDEFRDGGADVIMANGEPGNYADALSANTLAGEKNIPVLLTRKDKTPASVLAQLKDDAVKNIWVVGGTSVVSDAQVAALKAAGYNVTRVAGADRFATNNEIIKMNGAATGNTGLVATGFNFPDALAAGPFSFQGHPLALSTKDSIEDSTVQALKDAGVTKVLIFGGNDAVTPAVEAKLKAAGIDTAARFAGTDRADTSAKAAEYAVKNLGFSDTHVGVASGYVKGYGADALAGGPLEGKEKSPMLVTKDVNIPGASVLDYLKAHAATLKTGHIYGGTAAISAAAEDQMAKAAQTQTQAPSATALPELVSAKIVNTVTSTAATSTNPKGTRVAYTFDEAVTGAAPVAGSFKVYTYTDQDTSGSTAVVSADGRTVTVNFGSIDTDAAAGNLTLATVIPGAVTDGSGKTNPEGDAAIGAARTITGGAAGVTAAPDLVSVGNFRDALAAGTALVDFTFDENADAQSSSGYHLVLSDGTDVAGTGPAAGSTNPSGQNVPGGNGTKTFTVAFLRPVGMTLAQLDAATSRGTIDDGTVADIADAAVVNPLEAADVHNSGNTDTPDLVSATLQPGATSTDDDKVLYTFDEPVQATPDVTAFGVYDANGSQTFAAGTMTATRNPANSSQVLVNFGPGATVVDTAVGAIVDDGAVTAATGSAADPNQQDEVGVSNPTSTTVAPGKTSGPDLTGVALSRGSDSFGNPTDYRVTYTFDEVVNSFGAGAFKVYQADGNAITLGGCTILTDATGAKTNQVRCTTGATSATLGSTVLGTVTEDAVLDSATDGNPEGAEFTTGGTGTPSA